MYAVVSSGGKQYRVEAGSLLTLERLEGEPGASMTFDRVLLIGDGEEVTIGTPVVPGASVSATVLGEVLGPKLVIFKFKQKVKYRRRTGHRQHLTRVRIDAIHPLSMGEAPAARRLRAAKPTTEASEMLAPAAEAEPVRARSTRPRAAKAAAPDSAAPAEKPAEKPKARRAAKPKAEE